MCALLFGASAAADTITLNVDDTDPAGGGANPNLGTYAPASGAVIGYETWVAIDPAHDAHGEGVAPSSQGLALFTFDVATNTGIMQPAMSFSKTRTSGGTSITLCNWVGPYAIHVSGFGFTGTSFAGNSSSTIGWVKGPGAGMTPNWVPDVDTYYTPGLQPAALHNIGFGSPPGVDVGGNTTPAAQARDSWYLMSGEINVPDEPGTYSVEIIPLSINVIQPDADLNSELSSYLIGWSDNGDIVVGSSFTFTVIPEPATLSALLFGIAGLTARRRR